MAEVKSLKQVAAELGLSYWSVHHAARNGRLPAVQPFGEGTTWIVPANYRDFLAKSRNRGDAAEMRQDGNDVTKTG